MEKRMSERKQQLAEVARLLTRVIITDSGEEIFDTAVLIGRLCERYHLTSAEMEEASDMAEAMLASMETPNGN